MGHKDGQGFRGLVELLPEEQAVHSSVGEISYDFDTQVWARSSCVVISVPPVH
jgi:hypothetical protein